ncbi:hypothetical protein [Burkholderia territorii]|uniref:hypothetical protein n=1 Tax=Burkholderia territorii TaxID=1503055 RepID=UPI000A5E1E78|nr:hypothetical protein [Burkholderia territorii]
MIWRFDVFVNKKGMMMSVSERDDADGTEHVERGVDRHAGEHQYSLLPGKRS